MVTGSHNPPDQNGFKLTYGDGTLYGAGIQEIRQIIEDGRFTGGFSRIDFRDPVEPYLTMLRVKLGSGHASEMNSLWP